MAKTLKYANSSVSCHLTFSPSTTRFQAFHPLLSGSQVSTITTDVVQDLQQSADFQRLVRILRQLNKVGNDRIEPLRDYYHQDLNLYRIRNFIVMPAGEFEQYQIARFLVSGAYEPQGDWEGFSPGSLLKLETDNFAKVFESGATQIDDGFYPVKDYFAIGVLVPIKNSSGETIAALGVDYIADSEFDELSRVRKMSISILGISSSLSVVLSIILARWLGRPIAKLQQATHAVKEGNYDTTVQTRNRDELGELASTFNQMVQEINRYSKLLEDRNQKLQKLNQIKDEFLANTSHELRTPLYGIMGITQAMLDESSRTISQSQRSHLELIFNSGKRLVSLINDLLDLSKLKNHDIELFK